MDKEKVITLVNEASHKLKDMGVQFVFGIVDDGEIGTSSYMTVGDTLKIVGAFIARAVTVSEDDNLKREELIKSFMALVEENTYKAIESFSNTEEVKNND